MNDLQTFASTVITHMDDIRFQFETTQNNDLAAMLVGSYCRSRRCVALVASEDRKVAMEYMSDAHHAIRKHDGDLKFAIRAAMDRYESWQWEMDIEDCNSLERAVEILDMLDEAWEMMQAAEDISDWPHHHRNERFASFRRKVYAGCSMICRSQQKFACVANWATLIGRSVEQGNKSPLLWVARSLMKFVK